MARDPAANVGSWRQSRRIPNGPSHTRAKKWTTAALLSLLLAGTVALIVWLVRPWIIGKPNPHVLPFWVAKYEKPWVPPIPWVDADRQAFLDGAYFSDIATELDKTQNPVLQVMQTRLDKLAEYKGTQPVIVYIASHAVVDDTGQIQILAFDSDPYNPTTMLALRSVLQRLRKCPATDKLLVLDVMYPPADPLDLGGTADGVVDLVRHELQVGDDPKQERDPNLMVLCACSPGQTALGSESFGQSVFGHFLLLGFDDPAADKDSNNRISVRELGNYVRDRVDEWALNDRGVRQQPFLFGSDRDFVLTAKGSGRVASAQAKALADAGKRADAASKGAKKEAGAAGEKGGGADAQKSDETAKAKPADAPAEKGKTEKGKAEPAPESQGPVYPQWLADGWKTRETWWQQDDDLVAPRVFRRLDALLLRAEERCRAGEDASSVGKSFEAELASLLSQMQKAKTFSRPPKPVSLGQARALGMPPDPALAKALKELIQSWRQPPPLPADQVEQSRKAAVKAFLDTLKGKNSLDLAGAIGDALDEERLDARLITFVDGVVSDAIATNPVSFKRELVELRFLHQLAGLVKVSAGEFSDDVADVAWDVACRAEVANNQPGDLPWVRNLLDQADQLWHVGQVMLLPQARGSISWNAITEKVERTSRAYQVVEDAQLKLQSARRALGRALVLLPAANAYLEATGDLELELWLKACKAAGALDRMLEPPQQPLDADRLGQFAADLHLATRELDDLLSQFQRPFGTDALNEVIRKCESDAVQPDGRVAGTLEWILQTPFPRAADRQRLWRAGRTLDQRLAAAPAREPGSDGNSGRELRPRVDRRTRRLAALAELCRRQPASDQAPAGAAKSTEPASGREASAQLLATLARYARSVREALIGPQDALDPKVDPSDRTGWLAPIFAIDWQADITHQRLEGEALANWAFLAEHYRHQAHDLTAIDRFYESAVLDCPGAADLPSEVYLVLQSGQVPGKLSAQQGNSALSFQISLHAPGLEGSRKATLAVLKPDDPRLSVHPPADVEVSTRPRAVSVPVSWDEGSSATSAPLPAGLIIEAALEDGRTYHLIVPLEISLERERLRLVLSSTATSPVSEIVFDRLPLRPNCGRQAYSLFVRNPSDQARKVIVSVLSGGALVRGGETKPIDVPAHQTVPVQGLGVPEDPPLKPADPLPTLKGPLEFRLRDDKGQPLDRQELRPEIAVPLDYLEIRPIQFLPANGAGEPNRLNVGIRARPQMTGPPCPVNLELPLDPELFPALRAKPKGTLSDTVKPGAGEVRLHAENLALDPAGPLEGKFYLNVDGVPQALWYRANFALEGGPQRATEYTKSRVRFQAESSLKPGQGAKLLVHFAVANAPAGSRLNWCLRTPKGEEERPWSEEPRMRQVGFDPRGPGGALLFEASVQNWTHEVDVADIRGPRDLEARLIEPVSGREYDRYVVPMTLDDEPPGDIALTVPSPVMKGTESVDVSASVVPPASGISDVTFFVGKAGELNNARAAGQVAPGRPTSDPRTWEARLPLPPAAPGPILVTVQFTSGVGLSATSTRPIDVLVPKPKPPDAAANANAPPAPGAIAGKVIENDIPQPRILVRLSALDPNAKMPDDRIKFIKDMATGPDGSYAFTDLKPGTYQVESLKAISSTQDVKAVTVEAGKTTRANLDLIRIVRAR